jgi:fibronectin type 3 domain-containing protein
MRLKTTKLSSLALAIISIGLWLAPWHLFAQSAHKITVTWTAPSPIGGSGTISGYNVYRSIVSGSAYTKLNSTPQTALSYIDTATVPGTKYFYVITVVDSASSESAMSSEASATAIGNPNPPQGVNAVAQ